MRSSEMVGCDSCFSRFYRSFPLVFSLCTIVGCAGVKSGTVRVTTPYGEVEGSWQGDGQNPPRFVPCDPSDAWKCGGTPP